MSGLVAYNADTSRCCGSCQLCCTLLPVLELGKPRSTRCKYLRHTGCSIYHRRPDSCRYFQCGWLADPAFFVGVHLRPDHSGVVFDPMPDVVALTYEGEQTRKIKVTQMWVDPARPDSHRAPVVRAIIEKIANEHGMPTLARIDLGGFLIAAPSLTQGEGWIERESRLDEGRLPEDPLARLAEAEQ